MHVFGTDVKVGRIMNKDTNIDTSLRQVFMVLERGKYPLPYIIQLHTRPEKNIPYNG